MTPRPLNASRHRLSKFLLRHDRKYSGRTAWTGMHLDWIRKQTFEHEAQNRVLREYLHKRACEAM